MSNLYIWIDKDEVNNSSVLNCMKRALPAILKNELTETQIRYVTLRYVDNMKLEEIASACGVHITTVSRTLKRAHQRMRQALEYVRMGAEQYQIEEYGEI